MASWLTFCVAVCLLVVGARRWNGAAVSRRCIGVAAAAAGATLVVGLPPAAAWLEGRGVPGLVLLVQSLLICVAGTAAFAAAQRVALSAPLLVVPPIGVGLSVAAVQVTLFVTARGATGVHGPSLELVALWMITAVWPGVACVVLLSSLQLWGSALRGTIRATADLLRAGLLLLAVGAGLHGFRYLPVQPGAPWEAPAGAAQLSGITLVTGLFLIALGLAVPDLSRLLAPALRWGRAALVLPHLRRFADELSAATPEWRGASHGPRWTWSDLAHMESAVYRAVIRIRDSTWTLLGAVEDVEIRHAIAVALRTRQGKRPVAVAALAEACWLRRAVHHRTTGATPVARPYALRVLERAPDEPLGSLDEEVAFLNAVARAWRSRTARRFGARACSTQRCTCDVQDRAAS